MSDFTNDIEAYLNDELSPAERAAFEQAMKVDVTLRTSVENQRRLIEELSSLRLREKVKKNLQYPEPPGFNRLNGRLMIAAVAVLVCITVVMYMWMERDTALPNRIEVQPTPSSPSQTPIPQPSQSDSSPAVAVPGTPPRRINSSLRKAYVAAVGKLEALDYTLMGASQKDADLEKTINQAIGFLKREQASKALPLLEAASAQGNELYQDDVEWLLALAWLMLESDKGKAQLQIISANPAHSKRLDALELLHQLE